MLYVQRVSFPLSSFIPTDCAHLSSCSGTSRSVTKVSSSALYLSASSTMGLIPPFVGAGDTARPAPPVYFSEAETLKIPLALMTAAWRRWDAGKLEFAQILLSFVCALTLIHRDLHPSWFSAYVDKVSVVFVGTVVYEHGHDATGGLDTERGGLDNEETAAGLRNFRRRPCWG